MKFSGVFSYSRSKFNLESIGTNSKLYKMVQINKVSNCLADKIE